MSAEKDKSKVHKLSLKGTVPLALIVVVIVDE